MQISEQGLEFLIRKEGCVLHVYLDSKKLPTIGIGHLLTAADKKTGLIYGIMYKNGITREQAMIIKRQDMIPVEKTINKVVKVELTQNEYDALVSLVFNIGIGAFETSTLLRYLNTGNKKSAAEQFLVWSKQKELLPRRKQERTLFLTGEYPE